MIETLEKTIKDEKELEYAKEQLNDIVSIVVDDCTHILDKYDEKIRAIETKNAENELRVSILEEKLKYFEKKSIEEVANALEKDVATISRNKNRLINDLKIYFMPNDVLSDILGFWLRYRAKIVQKVRNWHTNFYIL